MQHRESKQRTFHLSGMQNTVIRLTNDSIESKLSSVFDKEAVKRQITPLSA